MMIVGVLLLCRYISHPLCHDVRIHDSSLLKMLNLPLEDTHANSNRQTRCTTGLERDST